jgi:hypothetical protein
VVRISRLIRRSSIPVFICVLAVMCLAVHELGHVLAGLCCGARVSEFVLLSAQPHVTFSNLLSRTERLWESAAGSCAEFAVFFLITLLAPRTRMGDIAAEVTAVFAGVELAGWTIAAAIYPGGPDSNDAWDFLAAAGSGRTTVLLIALCAAVLYVAALQMRKHARA